MTVTHFQTQLYSCYLYWGIPILLSPLWRITRTAAVVSQHLIRRVNTQTITNFKKKQLNHFVKKWNNCADGGEVTYEVHVKLHLFSIRRNYTPGEELRTNKRVGRWQRWRRLEGQVRRWPVWAVASHIYRVLFRVQYLASAQWCRGLRWDQFPMMMLSQSSHHLLISIWQREIGFIPQSSSYVDRFSLRIWSFDFSSHFWMWKQKPHLRAVDLCSWEK